MRGETHGKRPLPLGPHSTAASSMRWTRTAACQKRNEPGVRLQPGRRTSRACPTWRQGADASGSLAERREQTSGVLEGDGSGRARQFRGPWRFSSPRRRWQLLVRFDVLVRVAPRAGGHQLVAAELDLRFRPILAPRPHPQAQRQGRAKPQPGGTGSDPGRRAPGGTSHRRLGWLSEQPISARKRASSEPSLSMASTGEQPIIGAHRAVLCTRRGAARTLRVLGSDRPSSCSSSETATTPMSSAARCARTLDLRFYRLCGEERAGVSFARR